MTNNELEYINATSITKAVLAIKDDAKLSVEVDDVDTIIWYDGNLTNITKEQILAKQVELRVVYDVKIKRVAILEAKLADDSITFKELKELMRLRR